jgi:predicted metal-dependent enzyme (double-stranded beta helix superfamily)
MFDLDALIAECRTAVADPDPRGAIREVLVHAVSRPDDVAAALGKDEGGISVLYNTEALTILNVIWAPRMCLFPHDHRMWAAIGIYGGAEANTLYRRGEERLQSAGGRLLEVGDVFGLGADAIHSVDNPRTVFTGAIHIYGGDFVNQPRSQWDPDTLLEEPYDVEKVRERFARANEDWRRQLGTDLDESTD